MFTVRKTDYIYGDKLLIKGYEFSKENAMKGCKALNCVGESVFDFIELFLSHQLVFFNVKSFCMHCIFWVHNNKQ